MKILEAVIRWGEHELVRRMEEREPNLIANTIHSISRKGIRRSELNDEELKSILANLLPLVRIDYILPPFHQVITRHWWNKRFISISVFLFFVHDLYTVVNGSI